MKEAEKLASSHPEPSLSPSVQRLVSRLSGTPVHAGTVLESLFDQHPTYAGGRAGDVELGEIEQGLERAVEDWIETAWSILNEVQVEKLHGRLLTVCLAIEDAWIGRTLRDEEGFLESLEEEIEEPLGEVLLPDAHQRWETLIANVAESVPIYDDAPAQEDALNRKYFAEVVANRIREVWENRADGRDRDEVASAFMIHLHGRWGSGKTSVLNFLRDELTSGDDADRWIIVDFNGWRYQRITPPWWMLIKEVYRQGRLQLAEVSSFQAGLLRLRWLWWKFWANWLPAVFVVLGFIATILLVFHVLNVTAPSEGIKLIVGIVGTIVTACATLFAASRSLLFGSSRAAKTYEEISQDPLVPIKTLFNRLIDTMGRPVAVFIDDLDRCGGAYVVDLLEGIQTLFRDAPVTYVVAADRSWIRSSFEQAYQSFEGTIEEPGRPLGYLFLEKVFQFSVAIPRLSRTVQDRYWGRLLTERVSGDAASQDQEWEGKEKRARDLMKGARTQDELREVIGEHEEDEQLQEVLRARAAEKITSPEARVETEHQLEPFSRFLEPNPRSMKRLVNAYGLNQAVNFLEGRDTDFEALVLWTILSLRWPVLADLLAKRPGDVDSVIDRTAPTGEGLDRAVTGLFEDEAVYEVVKGSAGEGDVVLDASAIRSIVGFEGDEQSQGTR